MRLLVFLLAWVLRAVITSRRSLVLENLALRQQLATLIKRPAGSANDTGAQGKVVCRSRLGGMLNFYPREAA
jgi:hypothetical protein